MEVKRLLALALPPSGSLPHCGTRHGKKEARLWLRTDDGGVAVGIPVCSFPPCGKDGLYPLITFDDSLGSLLTVTFTGTNSTQEFDAYMSKMSAYLQRGGKYLILIDTRGMATAPNLEQRQRLMDWVQQYGSLLRQRVLGGAFVITSPFVRLAMNIMYQLKPLPCPYVIRGEIKDARAWLVERFRAEGLQPPLMLLSRQENLGTGALGGG